MSQALPPNPDLRQLKLQAKTLLKSARAGDESAVARIQQRRVGGQPRLSLADAQLAIAREYGFASWTKLKIQVQLAARTFQRKLNSFLELAWIWGDHQRAAALLQDEPELSKANIFAACAAGDEPTVANLLREHPKLAVKKGGPKKWPPMLYATWSCFLQERQDAMLPILTHLLDHGADPNSAWKNRQYKVKESALYGCVEANCQPAAKLLLDAGADPNDGESLYHACEKCNLPLLQTLGEYQLKPEDVSYCIKHAMDFRWRDGIQWFLDHGADPNAVHPAAQETSLHWAVKRGCSLDTIRDLLDAGADPNAKTTSGRSAYLKLRGSTPLDFALSLGRSDVADLLREYGAHAHNGSLEDRFIVACAAGRRDVAKAMLAENTNLVTQLCDDDKNLIAHVAQMKNWEGVKLMAELGWPIDSAHGWMEATPLTWALCFGEPAMVDFLLQRGASPDLVSGQYFKTPLNTVVHCRWGTGGDHVASLKRLLQEQIEIPEGFFPCGDGDLDAVYQRSWPG